MQLTSAIEYFCRLEQVCFSSLSLSESASICLILTNCFFGGMMANFDIHIFIIARENSCKIGRAPHGVRLISNNAGREPYDVVRSPAGHRPMFSYTVAGRRPCDMWPRKINFVKLVLCPGDYQFYIRNVPVALACVR